MVAASPRGRPPSGGRIRTRRSARILRWRIAGSWPLLLLGFAAPPAAAAQQLAAARAIDFETVRFERRLTAVRAAGPIEVDGVLGEDEWAGAALVSGFTQGNPNEGMPATFETEVRVLYDDESLYIGAFAYDDAPDEIIVNDLSRDFSTRAGDIFGVVLDTFHDRRNGYMFETNPAGAKFDGQVFNEGREFNRDWDGVWHVRTRRVAGGWQVEMAIPFKTLRFREDPEQTWGINFLRRVRRLNEDAFWAPIPRFFNFARVSYSGTLEGLLDLKAGGRFKITPYLGADTSQGAAEVDAGAEFSAAAGVDAKVLLGTGLNLDLTVNTDFSQVEADLQQVNLTRYSLFLPEKRDFFIENSGIFRFGVPSDSRLNQFRADFGQAFNPSVLRSSQSRGDDLYLFFSRRIGLSASGTPIPVLGGGRLTGRAGPYELGILNIQTGEHQDAPRSENFSAVRVRRNIGGNSDVGAIFLNREAGSGSDHFNRSVGADANLRITPELELNSYWARTMSPAANPEPAVDPGGHEQAARVAANYDGRLWQLRGAWSVLGDDFDPEMGFAPRVGIRRLLGYAGYHYRPAWWSDFLREFNPHFEFNDFENSDGELVSRYVNWHFAFRHQNGSLFEFGYNDSVENTFDAFDIHPTTVVQPGEHHYDEWFVMVFSNPSRPLSLNARYDWGGFYSGTRKALNLSTVARAGGKLTAYLGWSRNDIALPEGEFVTDLLTARLTWTFTTNMFLNALIQYNSVTEDWSSNIRFNLIHRPLSDFFIVLNDRRDPMGNRLDRALIAKYTILMDF